MRLIFALFLLIISGQIQSQAIDSTYFTPIDKEHLIKQFMSLPCQINVKDPVKVIIQKLEKYLNNYKLGSRFPHDRYAKAANLQALKSVKLGGYGIGAIIFENKSGKILHASYNKQLQLNRSDLHGEMAVITEFESMPKYNKYRKKYTFKDGITLFTTAEPCPMCFIRIATAGVETFFCTSGPDDGMKERADCLPAYWRDLAAKHKTEKANSSPTMQMISHLLFYSYMLDDRHI